MIIHVGAAGDIGRNQKRPINEDTLGVFEPPDSPDGNALFLICDGIGGYRAGEVASRIAVETISRVYFDLGDGKSVSSSLRQAIQKGHEAIKAYHAEHPEFRGMGTTVVAAAIRGHKIFIANVGDSRAYLRRNNEFWQVTVDHSRLQEMFQAGVLSKEEAPDFSQRNVVTRSLSTAREGVEVDIFEEGFQPGDVLLLCSDGLWGVAPDGLLERNVSRLPPQEAADALVSLANRLGGPDNISVIVVRRGPLPVVEEEDTGEFAFNEVSISDDHRGNWRQRLIRVIILFLGLAVLIFFVLYFLRG